jgi:class 3 adenylate cyclase/predicted Ser/Thr protein kinase
MFGRYHILKKLGGGGMGTVYLAQDTQLDRPVALKVPHIAADCAAQMKERFYREARAAAGLHHPHICAVYDVGEINGVQYLTMAYIEGQTLAELAAAGHKLAPRQAAVLVKSVAEALEEAHSQGVIHRDLKPSNLMINKRGEPIIMDFGLARRIKLGDERLTQEGTVLGTPAYMSPEQVDGNLAAVGPASDVYSLGVVLYELLTGQPPFQGPAISVMAQIISKDAPPPSCHRPDLDPRLEEICCQAMARDLTKRFSCMTAFAQALGDYLRAEESESPGQAAAPENSRSSRTHSLLLSAVHAEVALSLLRTWGWAMGIKKIKGALSDTRDGRQRAALQFCLRWLSGEADAHAEALKQRQAIGPWQALVGWALAGQAAVALRERQYPRAHHLLDQAAAQGDATDAVFRATVAHTHGAAYAHQGKAAQALPELHEALALLGREHFATGRVLDTLGMVYAGRGNFHVAREFYEQAIQYKQRFDDDAGLALSHGQLGRLYLDWGQFDQAEEQFQEDLSLAQKLLDDRGEAQMYNHLGQVALARGQREAAAGRKAAARRLWAEAAGWLDSSIRLSSEHELTVAEAFARKDRALAYLLEENIALAEEQAQRAEELFHAAHFAEGAAQVHRLWGLVRRAQGHQEESARALRCALSHFDETHDEAEAARTQWEIARTLYAAQGQPPLIARAFLDALERAEACRRAELVRGIEEELNEVDPEAYLRHIYRRARGRGVGEDTPSLSTGASEVVTVMFLDLQGFSDYSRGMDVEVVMMTLNQIMADLEAVLERHRARITTYFGDGFMALVRDARHAERALQAALDVMAALQEFNRPRAVLGWPLFQMRIGIHTGPAFLGNVGTYRKMSFTAVGAVVSLASRLLNWAESGLPCISPTTEELVRHDFVFMPGNPRTVKPVGLPPCEVWDVVGRKK